LLEALSRELEEETGWRVRGEPELINVIDWQLDPTEPTSGRREFDFMVTVDGDLARPRLEVPKQVDFRWIGRSELSLLDENRGKDEGIVRSLVEMALDRA
jgi:8-oxo-dGTP pyrophosphatase MutT (NUDIX family)